MSEQDLIIGYCHECSGIRLESGKEWHAEECSYGALAKDRDMWKERAESAERMPRLEWEGPDDDGDLVVRLRGAAGWGIASHGKTWQQALHLLGEGLDLAGRDDCTDCAGTPTANERAESAEALLATERELKELARSRWQEAQNRPAKIARAHHRRPSRGRAGGEMSEFLPGFDLTDAQKVSMLSLPERVDRAVLLLREHEPVDGYYGAFSGGKDSCAIKALASIAGVRVEWRYNNTTIDAPELVRFIKQHHADVGWNNSKHGNMLHRIATAPKVPPTRSGRWCCEEYKEGGGKGRTKIMGVRAQESKGRALRWREVSLDRNAKDTVICPIVFWSGWTEIVNGEVFLLGDVWEFLHEYKVSYCSLYDEGFDRLGCVGCMLQSSRKQAREFERWPRYRLAWRKAIISNWEKWKDIPNTKTHEPRYQAKFATGEAFWQWWLTAKAPDIWREDCQSGILWTNEEPREEPPCR